MTAWLAGDASALAEGALQLPALLDFPPSLVTAGLVYVARRAAGTYPAWPPCLSTLTGASLHTSRCALQTLADVLHELLVGLHGVDPELQC